MGPVTLKTRPSDLPPLLLRTVLILLVGAGVGLLRNALSSTGIPLATPAQPSFEELVNWSLHVENLRVTLKQAREAFDRGDAVFIDARPPHDYFAGHLPGARSLPVADWGARGDDALRDLSKDARLIVYCSGERCQSSILLARRLIEDRGFAGTRVFFDGWHAWNGAGFPFAIGEKP